MYAQTVDALTEEYCADNNWPWIIAWSGGKDSSLLLHLILDSLKKLGNRKRQRPITVLTNDTLVESPFVDAYIMKQIEVLKSYFTKYKLPIDVVKTTPDPKNTFWVNLIGRGYPAPTRHFR